MLAGVANATTGGWGNLGGGLTQILMPVVLTGVKAIHQPFIAWRFSMFVPGFMHILGGIMILFFSTDLPDGNYALLKKSGAMTKENPINVMVNALTNYRCARHILYWFQSNFMCMWGGKGGGRGGCLGALTFVQVVGTASTSMSWILKAVT